VVYEPAGAITLIGPVCAPEGTLDLDRAVIHDVNEVALRPFELHGARAQKISFP